MRSTLTALLYGRNGAAGVHVGDSRIYYYGSEGLEQLTVDDTIAAQVASKSGKADEWFNFSETDNRLAQHIGMEEGLEPHIIDLTKKITSVDKNSGFILTSDGTHYIGNIMIGSIIHNCKSQWDIGSRINFIADWLSGHDNMSILMLPANNFKGFEKHNREETTIQIFLSQRNNSQD